LKGRHRAKKGKGGKNFYLPSPRKKQKKKESKVREKGGGDIFF